LDGVLDALFLVGTERLRRAMEEGLAANEPGLAQLAHMGNAYRAFAHDEPDLFRLMFGRVDWAYRPSESVKVQAHALFEMLVAAVERATAAGQVRHIEAATVAMSIWAAVHGFVTLEINGFVDDCTPTEADALFGESMLIMSEGFRL
jgi:hypothetical protein